MEIDEYTIENLEKEFLRHHESLKDGVWPKHSDFCVALAMHVICKEIVKLKDKS